MTEKNKVWDEIDLKSWLNKCWSLHNTSQDEWRISQQACQQIEKCIHEAYHIPITSEREEELEGIIIEMQKKIDGLHKEITKLEFKERGLL